MTGLTARNFGLEDRGVLREGAYADLTLFDANEVDEAATYAEPIAGRAASTRSSSTAPSSGATADPPGPAPAGC